MSKAPWYNSEYKPEFILDKQSWIKDNRDTDYKYMTFGCTECIHGPCLIQIEDCKLNRSNPPSCLYREKQKYTKASALWVELIDREGYFND